MRPRASDKNGKDAYHTGSDDKSRAKASTVNSPAVASSARTPDLPNELLLLILGHVFPRREPDTPSSDHYPLRGTSHVLLVSRGFRELARPFFLRAVTITRAADYGTFFDPEYGLFAGEEGTKLWKLVHELSIVRAVHLPLCPPTEGGLIFMRPLWLPKDHRLHQVCVLDGPSQADLDDGPNRWTLEPGAKEWLAIQQADEICRAGTLGALRRWYDAGIAEERARLKADGMEDQKRVDLDRSYEESLWVNHEGVGSDSGWTDLTKAEQQAKLVSDEVNKQLLFNFFDVCKTEQDGFRNALIFACAPAVVRERFPSDLATYDEAIENVQDTRLQEDCVYIQHRAMNALSHELPPKGPWQHQLKHVTDLLGVRHVQFAPDYPDKVVQKMLKALKAADGLPIVSAIRKWSWTTPEGQIFELDMTDLTTRQVDPPLSLGETTT